MTDLFLRVVELSWQAGVLALAVMLARLALRRAPKWAVCMLWAAGGRCTSVPRP